MISKTRSLRHEAFSLLAAKCCKGIGISCPNTTATDSLLYLLSLVPFLDSQDGTGWDGGLEVLTARVARDEINNRTDLLPGSEY